MIQKALIFFVLFAHFLTMAQDNKLEWGELESRSGHLIEILPFHGKDFYTLRWKGGNFFGGYYLSRFNDLKEVNTKRVSIAVNQNIANFEQALIIDEHPSIVLSNIRDGREQVFLQQYSYELTPRGDAVLIADYEIQKGMSKEPIQIIQSKDKKYFAVLWLLIGKKKENDVYGYAVYDQKLNQIEKGEYEAPFESRFSEITNHLLSNTGHYFFVVKEYEPNPDKKFNQSDLVNKAMHIYQVNKDGELQKYTISVRGKRIEAISVNSDDSTAYTITGVYGANEYKGIQGVFYMKLDFQNEKILEENFREFGKDFITEDWSKKDIDRVEKNEAKGKDEPSLYNYQMREAQILPDGSMIGIMEQNYVVVRSFSDARSIMTYSYTYYYNDIIVFKIGSEGDFEWISKVKKSQVSTNDGGPFSSFASIVNGDKIQLIFNDNIENYDENGKYLANYDYYTRFNLKFNTVSLTEIDVKSGEQDRHTLFSRKETKTIAVPKQFRMDNSSNMMLLYTTYKGRELYGAFPIGNGSNENE